MPRHIAHFAALRSLVASGHRRIGCTAISIYENASYADVLPFPVAATTDFLAADILNKCGRAVNMPQMTRRPIAEGDHRGGPPSFDGPQRHHLDHDEWRPLLHPGPPHVRMHHLFI